MLWAFGILGFKVRTVVQQERHLERDFVGATEENTITLSNADLVVKRIQHLPEKEKEYLLPRVLQNATEPFVKVLRINLFLLA